MKEEIDVYIYIYIYIAYNKWGGRIPILVFSMSKIEQYIIVMLK